MSQYLINTRKHYRIWFSKNTDQFLNFENQLRFIKFRKDNPKAELSLIYSSKILSDKALKDMQKFCEKHDITPVDFDKDISKMLNTEGDLSLYKLIQTELEMWKSDKGGNAAAASDMARWLMPVIENCGIYSDFDVGVNFSKLPEYLEVDYPVIIPTRSDIMPPTINNEFIAVATNTEDGKVDKDAIPKIQAVQNEILKRSQDLKYALFSASLPGLEEIITNPDIDPILHCIYNQLDTAYNGQQNIYDLRKFLETFDQRILLSIIEMESPGTLKRIGFTSSDISQLSLEEIKEIHGAFINNVDNTKLSNIELSDQSLALIKHIIFSKTVINTTGPMILFAIYKDLNIEKLNFQIISVTPILIDITPKKDWNKIIGALELSSIYNTPMKNYIFSKNTIESLKLIASEDLSNPLDIIGNFGDQSWTSIGASKVQQRENKMNQAALVIQKSWKKHISDKKSKIGKSEIGIK